MDGFTEIFEDNKDGIKSICHYYSSMSVTLSEEDLFQEIAYQLFRGYKKYSKRMDCKTSTWVYRVAINVSVSMLRKENKISFLSIDETPLPESIEEDEVRKEEMEELNEAIKLLGPEEQALVFLYLDDKSHKEIAEILGISVSNVGTRLQRTKLKLKQLWNENGF